MKIKYFSILAIAFLSACKKENTQIDNSGKNLNEISVSAQFDWKTTHDVNFSFSVSDARFSNDKHVITVYSADPQNGGQILSKGAATLIEPYNAKIALPLTMTQVFVVKTAPDASSVSGFVKIGSTNISVAISESGVVGSVSGAKSAKSLAFGASLLDAPVAETSPACPSNPNFTITSSQGSYNFEAGKVYAITGNNISINNINEIKGKVYVCGTNVSLNGAQLGSGSELYILSGASVSFSNFNYNGNGNAIFKNFGAVTGLGNLHVKGTFYNTQDLKINGVLYVSQGSTATNFGSVLEVTSNLDNAGTFNNHGVLTVKGNLNSNNNNPTFLNTGTVNLHDNSTYTGKFTNDNTFNVIRGEVNLNGPNMVNNGTLTASDSKMNVSGTVSNNGSVTVKELNNTGSGKIINNCKWWVLTDFNNDNRFDNYSYIQVDNGSNLKGTFNLYNGAMLSTKYLWAADGIIEAFGNDTSLVKVITSSNEGVSANGGVKFKGKFQYCDPSRTINPSRFDGVAKQGCGVYIAKTSCNTVGNGTAPAPVKPDTDGDGIIDEEDDYPNDPDKAFKNYSVNYHTGGSSIAFEDSWPLKGDYDLNDIVITYRYMVATNAQNKVVQVNADYKLLATGGKFNNGAGIQFNLPSSSAKNFSGKPGTYLESGQDSVVVILFSDSRTEQQTWNTNPEEAVSPIVDYSISFDVVDGPEFSAFGISSYNPFIWNNSTGYGRGYETHLLGKKATNKANTNLFGTGDDNSVSGRTYSTRDNLPWALEIPTAPFKYPKERVAITDVYLKFAQWAASSGSQYPDWYTNTGSGYVNNSLIY